MRKKRPIFYTFIHEDGRREDRQSYIVDEYCEEFHGYIEVEDEFEENTGVYKNITLPQLIDIAKLCRRGNRIAVCVFEAILKERKDLVSVIGSTDYDSCVFDEGDFVYEAAVPVVATNKVVPSVKKRGLRKKVPVKKEGLPDRVFKNFSECDGVKCEWELKKPLEVSSDSPYVDKLLKEAAASPIVQETYYKVITDTTTRMTLLQGWPLVQAVARMMLVTRSIMPLQLDKRVYDVMCPPSFIKYFDLTYKRFKADRVHDFSYFYEAYTDSYLMDYGDFLNKEKFFTQLPEKKKSVIYMFFFYGSFGLLLLNTFEGDFHLVLERTGPDLFFRLTNCRYDDALFLFSVLLSLRKRYVRSVLLSSKKWFCSDVFKEFERSFLLHWTTLSPMVFTVNDEKVFLFSLVLRLNPLSITFYDGFL